MPQPDSGDNCCDCPSRASPCDDCGAGAIGACCNGDACSDISAAACAMSGGFYIGDGTSCLDVPPPCGVTGACCFPQQLLCPGGDDVLCGDEGGQFCLDSALPGDCVANGGTFLGFFPTTCAVSSGDCVPITSGTLCCAVESPDCCGSNDLGWACCTDIQTCCLDIDGFPSCCDAGQTCGDFGCE